MAGYVRDKMAEQNLSTHEVARRAKAAGFTLSNGTVSNILNCRVKDVKENTLQGLAKAFKVPEVEVLEVYYGKKRIGEEDLEDDEEVAAIFYNYSQLTEDDKRELRAVLRMFDEEIKRRNLKPKKKR